MRTGQALLSLAFLVQIAESAPIDPPHGPASIFEWNEIKHVIAFGDSYTYVQGTAGRQNYSFIGDYLPGNFTFAPEKLLTDKIVADYTGTSAGGPNWIEFLTNCGVEEGVYTPSSCGTSHHASIPGDQIDNDRGGSSQQRELWDFAFAGANYAEQFLPLHHDYTTPMVNQTQQYLTYAHPVLSPRFLSSEKNSKDVLVAVWIGINDINDIKLPSNTSTPMTEAQQLAYLGPKYDAINAALFEQSILPLYEEAGLTKFLFINLPPYDRSPPNVNASSSGAPVYPTKAMVDLWNRSLERAMTAFQTRIRDGSDGTTVGDCHSTPRLPPARDKAMVTTLLYDANTLLNTILDAPGKYGFWDTTNTCAAAKNPEVVTNPAKFGCLPIERYFWFDVGHITSHVHKILADDLTGFLSRAE